MKRAVARPIWLSFLILFLSSSVSYMLVFATKQTFFPIGQAQAAPFLSNLLKQVPMSIVVGLVVAGLTLVERTHRK